VKEKLYTIGYMIAVAAVFTSGVTAAKLATEEQVRLNEEARFQAVVLRVLGLEGGAPLSPAEVKALFARRIEKKTVDGLTVYCGYADDEQTQLVGYAFPVGGMGLWSKIEGMLALNKALDTVIVIDFTKQSETPGLGGRITEPWFRDQFKGKTIGARDDTGRYLRFMAQDKALTVNEVHGITGATMTTDGLDAFLNRDIERIRKAMGKAGDRE